MLPEVVAAGVAPQACSLRPRSLPLRAEEVAAATTQAEQLVPRVALGLMAGTTLAGSLVVARRRLLVLAA